MCERSIFTHYFCERSILYSPVQRARCSAYFAALSKREETQGCPQLFSRSELHRSPPLKEGHSCPEEVAVAERGSGRPEAAGPGGSCPWSGTAGGTAAIHRGRRGERGMSLPTAGFVVFMVGSPISGTRHPEGVPLVLLFGVSFCS